MIRVLFILFLSACGSVLAILPPDAAQREPEIRAYRQKIREAYEQRLEERRERAEISYERATKAIGVPPWQLRRVLDGESPEDVLAELDEAEEARKRVQRKIFVSIVLFILIGSAVLWVKHATTEHENEK